MKRTPLKRKARLRSKARLRRGCGIKPVNRKRRAARFAQCFGSSERVQWVNSHECLCRGKHPDCSGSTVNAHTKSRGAGGTAADVVPLSSGCHDAQHAHGWARWHRDAGLPQGHAHATAKRMATLGPDAPCSRVLP